MAHVDETLIRFVHEYGAWTYAVLFLVIFCETGLVATPFLPGDSLLFSAGALAAAGALDLFSLCALLSLAAVAGDAANYAFGRTVVARWLSRSRLVNRSHLARAESFYRTHGGKAIVLARFAPILRTFAPFVAGMARMRYERFLVFNLLGGVGWVGLCAGFGYLFGNLPVVKENFTAVLIAIVLVSLLPAVAGLVRDRREVL
ncbi:MAG TPA: VTT domain-containing protein [Vicinamibacteria bacterium]|nr:VTT domain-containing protein [Vicinamibacteria bacterium]